MPLYTNSSKGSCTEPSPKCKSWILEALQKGMFFYSERTGASRAARTFEPTNQQDTDTNKGQRCA